ncbi:MAG: putative toxin-antitoxin system toxin component, PIN family [Microcystaceae cyanobacterium]
MVIDTNVLFEGLTKQGGIEGLIIDAWLEKLMTVVISDALAYEYADVLSRKLSPQRWLTLKPVLAKLLKIAQFTPIYYTWRPTSPDPGDDLVIDCGINGNAIIITLNIKDFKRAQKALGLPIMTPQEFAIQLINQ